MDTRDFGGLMSTRCGYRTLLLSLLLIAGAVLLHAQTPTVTSVAAFPQSPGGPLITNGITAGFPADTQLCIFGSFAINTSRSVTWSNLTSGAPSADLSVAGVAENGGFLIANVPSALYATTTNPNQTDAIQIG